MRIVSPFPEEHLPTLWTWMEGFRRQMLDDHTPQTLEQMQQANEQHLAMGGKMFAVMVNENPVGAVWGEPIGDSMFMGHLVFAPDAELNKGLAVCDCLQKFFEQGARKVSWQSFADNKIFINFMRKRVHAEVEGTFKKIARRNGELVDMTILASFPEGA